MALTRNDKKVILVAVIMAVVVVGGLAWWRMSNSGEEGSESPAGQESSRTMQLPAPSPQPFLVGTKTSPSQSNSGVVAPLNPQEPLQTPPAQPASQPAPSSPQEPQQASPPTPPAGARQESPRVTWPATQAPQTLPSATQEASPGQESPQAAQPEPSPPTGSLQTPAAEVTPGQPGAASYIPQDKGGPEQAEDQAAALRRAEAELRHAEYTLKQKEKAVGEKSDRTGQSPPDPDHGVKRHVVDAVIVNETAHELEFTLKGVTGAAKSQIMLLASPPRLVVDLLGPWVYRGNKKIQSTLVKGVRMGRNSSRLRLVADLADMPGRGQPIVETSPEGLIIRINKPAT